MMPRDLAEVAVSDGTGYRQGFTAGPQAFEILLNASSLAWPLLAFLWYAVGVSPVGHWSASTPPPGAWSRTPQDCKQRPRLPFLPPRNLIARCLMNHLTHSIGGTPSRPCH